MVLGLDCSEYFLSTVTIELAEEWSQHNGPEAVLGRITQYSQEKVAV